ncbi:MAG: exonuclease domain-containing protein [Pseudobdellovibrionaceae bacterium]
MNRPWHEYTYLVFDIEAAGPLPIGFDLCEIGAITFADGKEKASYQTLLKPREPMSDFIIGIHGITNEMVADAPTISEKIREIHSLFQNSVAVAHHAPFDLGFMAYEFEKVGLPLPTMPAVCTSLLSRAVIPESKDHKLQTLVQHLGLQGGQAHRALDDTRACLQLFLECVRRLGPDVTLEDITKRQGKDLPWNSFSVQTLRSDPHLSSLVTAIEKKLPVDIIYSGGTYKGQTRRLRPTGIVRNPDGDWFSAFCEIDKAAKRFYLARVKDVQVVYI